MMTLDRALVTLEGRRGLVTGIANDQSIAWGCAKAFRLVGGASARGHKVAPAAAPTVRPSSKSSSPGTWQARSRAELARHADTHARQRAGG